MRRFALRVCVLLAAILLIGIMVGTDAAERRVALREAGSEGSAKVARVAEQLAYQSGWTSDVVVNDLSSVEVGEKSGSPDPGGMTGFEREILVEGIAHYTADVQVGDGQYDVIRIHRVVKEREPYRPIKTKKSIFLQHGDAVGFVKFLFGSASPNTPDDRSLAVYLAQNDVDVWGIDQDWILVPQETTDFDFMADWDLQHQVDNLDLAVEIARLTRRHTGNGFRRMHVLGYSSGAATVYAYANQETQIPRGHRNLAGIIPVDFFNKLDPANAGTIEWTCGWAEELIATYESGVYADTTGTLFLTLAHLATSAPDEPSPVFPGLTNFQAALFMNTNTFLLFPLNDWWHYMAGVFDENGLPYDLGFVTVDQAFDFMSTASPYEPTAFPLDYAKTLCPDFDVPYDDYLDEITLPVLYVGPVGGLGETGIYSTTLLTRAEVSLLMPQLLPDEERLLDIGHIDIWTSEAAVETVWQPLLDWIVAHSPGADDESDDDDDEEAGDDLLDGHEIEAPGSTGWGDLAGRP